MDPRTDLEKPFRASVLVSWAAVATLLIYAVLVEIIKSVLSPYPGIVRPSSLQVERYFLYGMAILVAIFLRVLIRALTKKKGNETLSLFVQKLSRAAVVISVVAELPALLGLISFLLTGQSRDFYYLLFVSLFLEFMYFPRKRAWEEMIRNATPQTQIERS